MPPANIAPPKSKGAATGVAGAYTKLSQVGKGSFGAVFLVRHTNKGGDTLILKEVQTKGCSQSEIRATKQEVAVLKRVCHPNIIGYVDTFEENGVVSIVMEYAAGGDLGRLIAKRVKEGGARFSETEIKRYATQLGSALEYLHNEIHLLHRDIKPKNVFLSGDGDVRLGDFGLSKVLSKSDGVAEKQVGTPLYMSPELAAGKPYDRSSDVWAFGCTLFECMGFKPPWNDLLTPEGGLEGGMQGLTHALRHQSLNIMALRSHYSEELCQTLDQLLAKTREKRLPLGQLISHLTEAPKHPASWGLSAEAQAALDEANANAELRNAESLPASAPQSERDSKEKERRQSLNAKSQSFKRNKDRSKGNAARYHGPDNNLQNEATPLTGCEERDEVEENVGKTARGIEAHAAAVSLQRSFRRVRMKAPGEESPMPARPPKNKDDITKKLMLGPAGGRMALTPAAPAPLTRSGQPRKPALKPSRVLRAEASAGGSNSSTGSGVTTAAPTPPPPRPMRPNGGRPAFNPVGPDKPTPRATPRLQSPKGRPKAPAAKKPGLKPTRVRDGLA